MMGMRYFAAFYQTLRKMSQEKSNNSIWLLLLGGFIILWFLGRIIALCLAFGGLIWWEYEKYVKWCS